MMPSSSGTSRIDPTGHSQPTPTSSGWRVSETAADGPPTSKGSASVYAAPTRSRASGENPAPKRTPLCHGAPAANVPPTYAAVKRESDVAGARRDERRGATVDGDGAGGLGGAVTIGAATGSMPISDPSRPAAVVDRVITATSSMPDSRASERTRRTSAREPSGSKR